MNSGDGGEGGARKDKRSTPVSALEEEPGYLKKEMSKKRMQSIARIILAPVKKLQQ